MYRTFFVCSTSYSTKININTVHIWYTQAVELATRQLKLKKTGPRVSYRVCPLGEVLVLAKERAGLCEVCPANCPGVFGKTSQSVSWIYSPLLRTFKDAWVRKTLS